MPQKTSLTWTNRHFFFEDSAKPNACSAETCTGGKQAKERLSVAFAVNMARNEKLPLLVIGKAAKLRCFKGRRLPSGMLYRFNTKAWMTSKLFEEYMRLLDGRLTASGRKIVTVVNNVPAHVRLDNLSAVKLEFLTANTTALSHPWTRVSVGR